MDALVHLELASMTIERSRTSNILSVPVGILICWLLWGSVPSAALLAWLALKVATTVSRIAVTRGFDRCSPSDKLRWGRRFELALGADGLTYGLLAPLATTTGDTVLIVVMTATVIAIAAVGLVVLSMSFRATVIFVLPVMLPSIPLLLARGDSTLLYLAAGSVVFLGLVVVEGARASAHTVAMLRLRFQMDEVAAQRAHALDLAERSSAVKSRFLATMSHEMRTPLHGILGLARLLREPTAGHPQATARLTMLERTGEHLLGLINDLLDHSRIEGGHLDVVNERFDLRGLLVTLADLVRVAATEKGLAVITDLDRLGPHTGSVWVEGDGAKLRQIVLNLLGNAVKFTARGHVTLAGRRDEARVVVEVIDTGAGVPAADRERIFNAFEQADSSYARRHGGTGLGLTISRELARAMGGDVSCLGHPSGGAVFRLVLPLPAASPPASATRETHVPAALRGRVLLAEDNEVNAIVAQALLARHGVEVRTATDGRSTVELASREAFDLILMDAQMPELDGFEAAAAIRIREAEQGRRRTPIVAVTANAQPSDRARSLAAGMDDHLAKPYRDDELEAVLRRYLAASA